MHPPMLVVGAGVSGLTFALTAAERGRRVILLERGNGVGGAARSFQYGRYRFDFGLHAFVSRDAAVIDVARRALGPGFHSFTARPASWAGPGRWVPDEEAWRRPGLFAPPPAGAAAWNCMRVQRPPTVVYPRRGGFAAVAEGLARRVRAAGGRIRLGAALRPSDLELRGGVLRRARLNGRLTPVAGCFWSAGGEEAAPDAGSLLLLHYLVEGKAPKPYHWVRVAAPSPLLPSVVYYPSNFSASNAPAGAYGVAAAVPVPPGPGAERGPRRTLLQWFSAAPEDFASWTTRFLAGAGFLDRRRVRELRLERVPLPLYTPAPRRKTANPRGLWRAADFLRDAPGESLAPLQMAAALRAAGAALGTHS